MENSVAMRINFISFKYSKETLGKGIMMGNETDEIIKKLPDSLLQNY